MSRLKWGWSLKTDTIIYRRHIIRHIQYTFHKRKLIRLGRTCFFHIRSCWFTDKTSFLLKETK